MADATAKTKAEKEAAARAAEAKSHHLPDGLVLADPEPEDKPRPRPDDEAQANVPALPEGYGVETEPRTGITGPNGGAYEVVVREAEDGARAHALVASSELRAAAEEG